MSSQNHTVRDAHRLLKGLEDGSTSTADLYIIAQDLDPVLLFWVFRYLRDKYPASNPSSQGVLMRLLELSRTYPELVASAKKGEQDLVSEWFNETFSTAEFYSNPSGMLENIVEKLEG